MTLRPAALAVAFAASAFAAERLPAQTTGAVGVDVAVLSGLAINAVQNLRFGKVRPGQSATIVTTTETGTTGAGLWYIQGNKNKKVTLSFALPTQLTNTTGPGSIPVNFGPTSACWSSAGNTPTACAVTFNPASPPSNGGGQPRLSNTGPGELWVWIGGNISTTAVQPPGLYTATISLTVTY